MEKASRRRQGWVNQTATLALTVGALSFGLLAYQYARVVAGEAAANRQDEAASRQAFLAAYKVLMHPRCMNCHPAGDVPLQSDDSRLHAQNVKRGPDGKGLYALKCANCHQDANLPGDNMPPGNPSWHLPPAKMR